MLIQCPGSYLLAFSIYIQENTDWSSYLSFLVSGSLQGILLVMCVIWQSRENAQANFEELIRESQDD